MLQQLASAPVAAAWLAPRLRGALRTDHRRVGPGDAFLAWPGARHDARAHVADALQAGAVACLVEADGATRLRGLDDPRVAALQGLERLAGEVASACLGTPSARLDVVAVTGTNGKTSTSWWIAQALQALGRRCGVVGTLGVGEPPALVSTGLTTPDAVALQTSFAAFARDGLDACAIEASSIGIDRHRLTGTRVAVAAFTNFTRDHLDYHGTMEAYWAAKRRLFDWAGLRAAVVNLDDPQGAALAAELQAGARAQAPRGVPAGPSSGGPNRPALWTVSRRAGGVGSAARLQARGLRQAGEGLAFDLVEDGQAHPVHTTLLGDYNVDNLLVVAGCLRALGLPLNDIAGALALLRPVPGRLQAVRLDNAAAALPEVVVDYAHTPDALEKALAALAPRARARGGLLWCVFGCGGDRDATKRAPMGVVAARAAQRVVVTSDNPRSEVPGEIVLQVLAGTTGGMACVRSLEDRREAIALALREAAPQDVVLIAGKGHEQTQEIAGKTLPFSDTDEALRALRLRLRLGMATGSSSLSASGAESFETGGHTEVSALDRLGPGASRPRAGRRQAAAAARECRA